MAWIELHQSVWTHKKTLLLAAELDMSETHAVAHLIRLWTWALDNAPTGDISGLPPKVIAIGAGWDKDPEVFVRAAINAGWFDETDEGLFIHDWQDYAGRLMDQRRHAAQQKRRHRELYNNKALVQAIRDRDKDQCRYCGRPVNWRDRKGPDGATYDYVDPDGPTSLENIVVACRACNAGKNQRTPEEAGYTLLPLPTRNLQISSQNQVKIQPVSRQTVPNLTVPNRTGSNTPPIIPPKGGSDEQTAATEDNNAISGESLLVEMATGEPDEVSHSKTQKRTKKNLSLVQKTRFDKFWAIWPNKISKGQAEITWGRLDPDDDLTGKIIEGVRRAIKYDRRFQPGGFMPHASTWLNAKGWEDEYPVETEVNANGQRGQYSGANTSKPIDLDKFLWQGT